MNKKTIIMIISGIVLAVIAAVIVIGSIFGVTEVKPGIEEQKLEDVNNGEKAEEPVAEKEEEKAPAEGAVEEERVYTPTFVYFTSNEFADTTKDTLEKLKKEYKDRVNFDIRNVDETGEDMSESFGNENLPVLLMHDKNNNMCAVLMMATDYEMLKGAIETAFAD